MFPNSAMHLPYLEIITYNILSFWLYLRPERMIFSKSAVWIPQRPSVVFLGMNIRYWEGITFPVHSILVIRVPLHVWHVDRGSLHTGHLSPCLLHWSMHSLWKEWLQEVLHESNSSLLKHMGQSSGEGGESCLVTVEHIQSLHGRDMEYVLMVAVPSSSRYMSL